MKEIEETRIWNPTSDEIYTHYAALKNSQKLQLWIRIYVEETLYNNDYNRMRIEIPRGLTFQREFKDNPSGLYDEEYVLFKEYESDEVVIHLKICDITCICIIDEE